MAGTEAEELEGIKQVLDGTTTGTPILAIRDHLSTIATRLTEIRDVANGTTTGTPILSIATEIDQLTTVIGADLDTIIVEMQDLEADLEVGNSRLQGITTALGSISITVVDSNTAAAIADQTSQRPPTSDPSSLRQEAASASRRGKSPRTTGNR